MTAKQKHRIKGDQLIIELLEDLKSSGKDILESIEDISEMKTNKVQLMKKAANDPLFLKDIEDISVDFEISDLE